MARSRASARSPRERPQVDVRAVFSRVAIGVVGARIIKHAQSRRRARHGRATLHRHSRRHIGPNVTQQRPPGITLLWRRRWSGSSPSPLQLWRTARREANDETRSTSVGAVAGRSPRSDGIRAAGVVGGDQLNVSSGASLPSARSRFEVRDHQDGRHGSGRDGCCRRRHAPCGSRRYVVCPVRLIGTSPTSAGQGKSREPNSGASAD
jgi:hypothetical protein